MSLSNYKQNGVGRLHSLFPEVEMVTKKSKKKIFKSREQLPFNKISEILSNCESLRSLDTRGQKEVLSFDEGFALHCLYKEFEGGDETFRSGKFVGWAETDQHQRELDNNIEKWYSPLNCKTMIDKGLCKKSCPSSCMPNSADHPANPIKLAGNSRKEGVLDKLLKQLEDKEIPDTPTMKANIAEEFLKKALDLKASKLECDLLVEELKAKLKVNKTTLLNTLKRLERNRKFLTSSKRPTNRYDMKGLTTPDGYSIAENGIFLIQKNEEGEEYYSTVSSGVIFISAIVENVDTKEYGYVLNAFYLGQEITAIVTATAVTTVNEILKLSAKGFPVNQVNATNLIIFLDLFIVSNQMILPKIKTYKKSGWNVDSDKNSFFAIGEQVFHPSNDHNIALDLSKSQKDFLSEIHEEGNRKHWLTEISKLLEREPAILFALGCAVSAMLIRQLGVEGYILHYWDDSSKGKTTMLMAVLSFFGKPKRRGLLKTWNSTLVGFEARLNQCNDLPCPFDDSSEAKDDQIISDLIYMLSNGQGKQRATRGGDAKEVTEHITVGISTGEGPLIKSKDRSGKSVRTLEFNTSPFKGYTADEIEVLRTTLKDNYGFGFKKIATELTRVFNDDDLFEELRGEFKRVKKRLIKKFGSDSNLFVRALDYFAASEVALNLILKELPELNLTKSLIVASIDAAAADQFSRLTVDNRVHFKAYEHIWNFIMANNDKFQIGSDKNGEQYGKEKVSLKEDSGKKVECCSILPLQLKKILDLGEFDSAACIEYMKREGLFLTRNGSMPTVNFGNGLKMRGYSLTYEEARKRGVLSFEK
jgi:hypothetical protein